MQEQTINANYDHLMGLVMQDKNGRTSPVTREQVLWIRGGWCFTDIGSVLEYNGLVVDFDMPKIHGKRQVIKKEDY